MLTITSIFYPENIISVSTIFSAHFLGGHTFGALFLVSKASEMVLNNSSVEMRKELQRKILSVILSICYMWYYITIYTT